MHSPIFSPFLVFFPRQKGGKVRRKQKSVKMDVVGRSDRMLWNGVKDPRGSSADEVQGLKERGSSLFSCHPMLVIFQETDLKGWRVFSFAR